MKVQVRYRKKYGPKTRNLDSKLIKVRHVKFKETGACLNQPVERLPTVHREGVIKSYEENPRQSIRKTANNLGLSHTASRDTLKDAGYKPYRTHMVQTLNREDYGKRVAFSECVLNKMEHSLDFVKLLLISDEAIFHLEGSVNEKNSSRWAKENPNWIVENSLKSPRVMVWTTLGSSGVLGPIFFEGNANAVSYLQMIENEFYPQFMTLKNSSQIIFQHDGAPLHRARTVRDWLNDKKKP